MSREIPAALEAAIDGPVVRPFLAVRIELPDPVYAWTGTGTLVFNDGEDVEREWTGTGSLGSIDTIGEATDGSATGMKVSLFQVPSEFGEDIADQATKGALFEVYAGALNEAMQMVEAVQLIWKGRLDEFTIVDSGTQITVEITGESRGIDQQRPAVKKFTDEYQQRQHPGDLFFQFVPQMAEVSVLWAKAEQKTVPVAGSSSGAGGFAQAAVNMIHE